MDAAPGGPPFGDGLRVLRAGHVVDAKSPAKLHRACLTKLLVIDHEDTLGHPDLVRMPAFWQIDASDRLRPARISDIHDRRATRPAHVAAIKHCAIDPDLAATGAIDMRQKRRI